MLLKVISRSLLLSVLLLTLTACPKFQTVRYPDVVYLGDTVKIHLEMFVEDYEYGFSELYLTMPDGWELAKRDIKIKGMSDTLFQMNPYEGSWRGEGVVYLSNIGDSIYDEVLSWNFFVINNNSFASLDTIRIIVDDSDWFYETAEVIIESTDNTRIPTHFMKDTNRIFWNPPKQMAGFIGYRIIDNNETFFSYLPEFPLRKNHGIHRYSVETMYRAGKSYGTGDNILDFQGDSIYLSPDGQDENTGTRESPLQSIQAGLFYVDDDLLVDQQKTLVLTSGMYNNISTDGWRSRVNLAGDGVSNTIILQDQPDQVLRFYDIEGPLNISDLTVKVSHDTAVVFRAENLSIFDRTRSVVNFNQVHLINVDECEFGILNTEFYILELNLSHVLIDNMDSLAIQSNNHVSVQHSNLVNNHSGIKTKGREVNITNSIFYNNVIDVDTLGDPNAEYGYSNGYTTELTLNHNIISEEFIDHGTNNMSLDPLFVNDLQYPYLLDEQSPAVDAADSYDLPDPFNDQLARFPARGTIQGDLGIYGGLGQGNVTHIRELEWNPVSIYPNPVKSVLWIDRVVASNNMKIWLVDPVGRIISIKRGQQFIDVSDYPAGVYMVVYQQNDRYGSKKIVKQ